MPSGTRANNDYAGIAANTDVKAKAEIGSWQDCFDFLAGRPEAKLASNVKVVYHPTSFSYGVVLYGTEIVTYYPSETFSVRNGGFNTPTTRTRVTQFTPDGYVFFHEKKKLTLIGVKGSVEDVKLQVKREA